MFLQFLEHIHGTVEVTLSASSSGVDVVSYHPVMDASTSKAC